MKQIVISGGHVVTPVEDRMSDVVIDGPFISQVGPLKAKRAGAVTLDATNCWVTPGLIDIQVNGGPGCDFWGDPDTKQVAKFADELSKAGVTTILPTLITDDLGHLRKNLDFLEKQVGVGPQQLLLEDDTAPLGSKPTAKRGSAVKERPLPVRMPGVHLEGPCLSPERPGVHPTQHLQPLNREVLEKMMSSSVKLITLAPELDSSGKSLEFLRQQGVTVALGHSNATFEQAEVAFEAGIRMMTHTFNALPPIHHRSPGAVTAALLDNRVFCCVIADGQHLAPATTKLIFRSKGIDKSILVTDIAFVGTSQGGLVGSSIMLSDAVRNVVQWGAATFQQAIAMATYNAARALGWEGTLGHIAKGKHADIVVWDKQTLAIKHVIAAGELLF